MTTTRYNADDADFVAASMFDALATILKKHPYFERDLATAVLGRTIALCDRAGVSVEAALQSLQDMRKAAEPKTP